METRKEYEARMSKAHEDCKECKHPYANHGLGERYETRPSLREGGKKRRVPTTHESMCHERTPRILKDGSKGTVAQCPCNSYSW